MSPPWKMPEVCLADPVLWSPGPDGEVSAAVVTRVGPDAISVMVLCDNARGGVPRDAVRHVDDPKLAEIRSDAGVWRPSARAARVERRLAEIEQNYRDLVGG